VHCERSREKVKTSENDWRREGEYSINLMGGVIITEFKTPGRAA
jgi:hypothetical protein